MPATEDDPAAEDRQRHGYSFGTSAAAYAEHRPDYPGAALAWALPPAAGAGRLRVVDLGAGTGKLTRPLAALTAEVVAVEPDPAMLAELRRAVPGARAVAGRAEDIPLPDGWADAVLAGQAAHWFDLPRAIPEIARVLAPGGVLAGLWNTDDDRVGWVAGLAEATAGLASVPLSQWRARAGDAISAWLGPGGAGAVPGARLFGPPQRGEFEHWQVRTADSLVATIATHSAVLLMEPAERDRVLGRVRAYLASRPETASGSFRLPLVTCVTRTVRVAG
ncbi:MAG: class I SAM-dependent methyltransferase [Actinobacteria bacterium]|nr:class I SAM-dependent methyltransferase [Actinomycetota bacterium]MBO0785023.1 class I SAM-dependent methyltransferase [Actinomycetota bacterium]